MKTKSIILLIALIGINTAIIAQNSDFLETIIPKSASMVLKINGKGLTKKVGMKNIAKSEAFLKLLEGEIFMGNDKKRVTEIGVNLERDVYMIYKSGRDMNYTAYLYHIEKPKLFAKYIAEKNEFVETEKTDNYNIIFYKAREYYYSNSVEQDFLAWNDDYAIYVDVSYVRDSPLREEKNELNALEEDLIDARVETVMEAVEEPAEESVIRGPEYYKELEAEREARQKRQDSLKEAKRLEKLAIARGCYANELDHYFGVRIDSNSILKNKSYIASRNEKSDLSFWMNFRNSRLPFYAMNHYPYRVRRNDFPGMLGMYLGAYAGKDLNAHLFFNENEIMVKSNVQFMPEVSQLLQGVYSSSIPKSYLKYINTDKVLGVTSASINASKFWEAFPSMYADAMKFAFRGYPDEKEEAGINLLVDFISIMIDEEAMGKLVTGSSVLVLKELVPREVEYFTYEYNEDYSESKRVKKTKTEIFPDFLLMFGSENKAFMTKLLDFACKNEVLYRNGNYYYSDGKSRDFPFSLYFTITDDMAFVSTSIEEIKTIANGKSVANLDKKVASNILKNSSYFNLNLPELLKQIPKDQLSSRETQMLNYFQENGGEIEWFNNYNNNQSQGTMQMNTPDKFKNSALFVWDLLETVHQMEEDRRKERAETIKASSSDEPVPADVEYIEEAKCEEGKCEGGR